MKRSLMFAGALAFLAAASVASSAAHGATPVAAMGGGYGGHLGGSDLPLPTLNRFVRVAEQVALEPAGAPFAGRTRAGSHARPAPIVTGIVNASDLDPG